MHLLKRGCYGLLGLDCGLLFENRGDNVWTDYRTLNMNKLLNLNNKKIKIFIHLEFSSVRLMKEMIGDSNFDYRRKRGFPL